MKARFFGLVVLLLINHLLLAQAPKVIKARLDKATVYLQGAHLYYQENVTLAVGNNDFIFENISPGINAVSLQAASKGGVVMDVKHRLKYSERPVVTRRYDKELQQVADSLEKIAFGIKGIENKMSVLEMEKKMLLNHPVISGRSTKDSLPVLRDGMNFLRERLNNIYDLELKWETAKAAAGKTQARLNERYEELQRLQGGEGEGNEISTQPVNQVMVTVYSETAGAAAVSFDYYIQEASWTPLYDLQASSVSNTFQLKYFANVLQQSGLDWKNVKLTLSTSNPNENNIKPQLAPWMVSFINYMRKKPLVNYRSYSATVAEVASDKKAESKVSDAEAENLTMEEFVTINENLIRMEYEIKLNYNIGSDGLPHKVIINQREIPMQLEFAAVPKLSTDAFLMANVTGWEDLDIIPGNARLYFDGAYVGEMYLNANSTSDTLQVNLGRDKTIALTRKKIKEKCKVSFMGDDKVETRTIELTVRNTKNIPIQLILEDQIPVAQGTEEIEVKLISSNGAELDETTGLLTWKLKLGSKDTKKIVFTYEVRYPKGKTVAGL